MSVHGRALGQSCDNIHARLALSHIQQLFQPSKPMRGKRSQACRPFGGGNFFCLRRLSWGIAVGHRKESLAQRNKELYTPGDGKV